LFHEDFRVLTNDGSSLKRLQAKLAEHRKHLEEMDAHLEDMARNKAQLAGPMTKV